MKKQMISDKFFIVASNLIATYHMLKMVFKMIIYGLAHRLV